eukprot:CAMPEP_0172495228 /NCGR_PEP_ID=MMETSP1066-20121228/64941_1 /TAXON_ID=671091 /ORGANISM="Coscinodiscus wailesii, Strain CCMP2513" /LENGTH=232 /DNA_ID=CAMNT_0013266759 /DNA_START=147 /DNA_END=841 /DNA_ORIENTATION=-
MTIPEINNQDLLALRNYVTAPTSQTQSHRQKAATTILLDISHSNLTQRHIEIRFDKCDTISELRYRIHRQTGTPPQYQRLKIMDGMRRVIRELPPPGSGSEEVEHRPLGYFGMEDGWEVNCIDTDPHSGSKGGWYEDTALVPKYRMSEEKYNERKGTLREWGREQKQKDENFTFRRHESEHKELAEARRVVKLGGEVPEGFELDGAGVVIRKRERRDESGVMLQPGAESVVG